MKNNPPCRRKRIACPNCTCDYPRKMNDPLHQMGDEGQSLLAYLQQQDDVDRSGDESSESGDTDDSD
jgi:hypothetical protein